MGDRPYVPKATHLNGAYMTPGAPGVKSAKEGDAEAKALKQTARLEKRNSETQAQTAAAAAAATSKVTAADGKAAAA